MKSLSQGNQIEMSYLSSGMGQVEQVGYGISTALLNSWLRKTNAHREMSLKFHKKN